MTQIEPNDAYNRQLLQNAHPPEYINPVPASRYNLVVIGAGPAGLVAAAGAAGLGAKVALVERHLMGGDCLNVGCVPSKALIQATRAIHAAHNLPEFGGRSTNVGADFSAVMERMRKLRAGISAADSVKRFTGLGVDVFLGEGKFTAPDIVDVNGVQIRFARAGITAGSRPEVPPIPGLGESGFETNLTLFNLTELPARLAVIGGGPIGCEMAQAFQRLGSRVTLLQSAPRLLPRDDPEASALIKSRFEAEGINVCVNAKVTRVVRNANGEREISYECAGKSATVTCDRILVAAGRIPELAALNLDAAGVSFDKNGIIVDDFLRTSNRRIYAAGDVCSKYKFTHAADAMARILIRNALFFGRQRVSKLIVPWATYTDPEVAQVGLTAEDAAAAGVPVDVLTVELRDVDRAILDGEQAGFGRLILARGTDTILGATLTASHAGDLIGEAALAMTAGLGASKLSSTIHPYPTQSEVWKKLGDIYNRTRLSPGVKSAFTKLMKWRRG